MASWASCIEQSTPCPGAPFHCAITAPRTPTAAVSPPWYEAIIPPAAMGGRSGNVSRANPLGSRLPSPPAWNTFTSWATYPELGPVDPKGVIPATMRREFISASDSCSRPRRAAWVGGESWMMTSASAANCRSNSRPFGSSTSSVIPCFPVFRYRNIPLRSGWGESLGNGPRRRDGSPDLGGSTFTTSAPSDASSLPQYGAATMLPNSSTRNWARAEGFPVSPKSLLVIKPPGRRAFR